MRGKKHASKKQNFSDRAREITVNRERQKKKTFTEHTLVSTEREIKKTEKDVCAAVNNSHANTVCRIPKLI